MSIFDNIARDDTEPPPPSDAQFAYLNRSGRPEAARVREKAKAWFAGYPDTHRDDLVVRFRSAIEDQHQSAFFELFLSTPQARGCKVLAIRNLRWLDADLGLRIRFDPLYLGCHSIASIWGRQISSETHSAQTDTNTDRAGRPSR